MGGDRETFSWIRNKINMEQSIVISSIRLAKSFENSGKR